MNEKQKDKQGTYICPDCGSEEVDKRNGEVVCTKCGLVLE